MGLFVKADILVVPFPFSNLKAQKKRPVLVVQESSFDDLLLMPFTSKVEKKSKLLYRVSNQDVVGGDFAKESSLVLDKFFTLHSSLVIYKFGALKADVFEDVVAKAVAWLKG
jgi:mRNA interferase MazF